MFELERLERGNVLIGGEECFRWDSFCGFGEREEVGEGQGGQGRESRGEGGVQGRRVI